MIRALVTLQKFKALLNFVQALHSVDFKSQMLY